MDKNITKGRRAMKGIVSEIPGLFRMHTISEMEKMRFETFEKKEPETLAWIGSFAGGTFVDVGANIGVYTMYAAHRHPAMKVYAFEPVRRTYHRLVDNLRLNNFPNVVPMHVAVANRNCLSEMYVKIEDVAGSGSQIDEPVDEHNGTFTPLSVEIVAMTSLNALFELAGVLDYIKIDVDGRESTVLGGADVALLKARSVLVECNTDRLPLRSLESFMGKQGLAPDPNFNALPNHSSKRRGGNPVNVVFSREVG